MWWGRLEEGQLLIGEFELPKQIRIDFVAELMLEESVGVA